MKTSRDNPSNVLADKVYERESVPNTDALKSSIIECAKGMPQQALRHEVSSTNLLSRYRLAIRSVAIAAVLLVAVVSLFSVNLNDEPISPDIATESELDWQELMLIDDELLFANL